MPISSTTKESPDSVWIVVPAYNEARRITHVLGSLCGYSWNVIVVDDGSRDDTFVQAGLFPVWRLRHQLNLGQGAAIQTGITFALAKGATWIVTFDGDGQHQISDIDALLHTLVSKPCDFALGSRFLGESINMPLSRWFVLKAAVLFTRILTGAALTDTHNGLRAMTALGASRINLTLNRMEHASQILEQIVSSGLPYAEVPVTIKYSEDTLTKGQSSLASVRMGLRLLLERILA